MANEIQELKLELKPAEVKALNINDIVDNVDELLKKYRDFPVVEETEKVSKDNRAVLNKTVDKIKRVRIDTESELLGNWSETKDKMLSIESKGKEVADLIGKQLKELEEQHKAKKRIMVDREIIKLSNEVNIDSKRITFNPKWLNKSYSWVDMQNEIHIQLDTFIKDDELKALRIHDLEIVAKELGIDVQPYVTLIEYRDIADIKKQMRTDVEIKRAMAERDKKVKEEAKKAQQERFNNAKQIGDKHVDDNGEVVEAPTQETKRVIKIEALNDKQFKYVVNALKTYKIPFVSKVVEN